MHTRPSDAGTKPMLHPGGIGYPGRASLNPWEPDRGSFVPLRTGKMAALLKSNGMFSGWYDTRGFLCWYALRGNSMTPVQIAKLLVALELIDEAIGLIQETVVPSCAEDGHACHHCTECDPK